MGVFGTICMNASIDMMPVEGIETQYGDSGLRPLIDNGRCCWCALCVDICATGSLTLSNSFKWGSTNGDDFRFIPGVDKKYWDNDNLGYVIVGGYDLNDVTMVDMGELDPSDSDKSFVEMITGYSKEKAQKEADKFVECGFCTATCRAYMGIPSYIKAVREDDIEEGLSNLYETNPLPEICVRICTHKCETVCAINHKGDPLSIRWLKRYIADQVPSDKYKEILRVITKK